MICLLLHSIFNIIPSYNDLALDRGLWKHNKIPPSFSLIIFQSNHSKRPPHCRHWRNSCIYRKIPNIWVFFQVSIIKRIYLLFLTFRTESSVSFRYRDTLDISWKGPQSLTSPVCYSNLRKTWPYPALGDLSKCEVSARQRIRASPHMSVIIQGKILYIYVIKNVHRTLY